eukprot:3823283-Rhodomonas_salina.1
MGAALPRHGRRRARRGRRALRPLRQAGPRQGAVHEHRHHEPRSPALAAAPAADHARPPHRQLQAAQPRVFAHIPAACANMSRAARKQAGAPGQHGRRIPRDAGCQGRCPGLQARQGRAAAAGIADPGAHGDRRRRDRATPAARAGVCDFAVEQALLRGGGANAIQPDEALHVAHAAQAPHVLQILRRQQPHGVRAAHNAREPLQTQLQRRRLGLPRALRQPPLVLRRLAVLGERDPRVLRSVQAAPGPEHLNAAPFRWEEALWLARRRGKGALFRARQLCPVQHPQQSVLCHGHRQLHMQHHQIPGPARQRDQHVRLLQQNAQRGLALQLPEKLRLQLVRVQLFRGARQPRLLQHPAAAVAELLLGSARAEPREPRPRACLHPARFQRENRAGA